MKPGGSLLNPYAASYVPLAKREANDQYFVTTEKNSKSHDATIRYQTAQHIRGDHHSPNFYTHATKKLPAADGFHAKSQPTSSSYGSSSQNVAVMTDKQMLDVEADMDLEYLRMTFPGISYQSLSDVYIVNGGDLDAAIDMLGQLEFDGAVSSGSLPDTLDIGDVSESGSSAESATLKLKNVATEASSSSNSLASANVS